MDHIRLSQGPKGYRLGLVSGGGSMAGGLRDWDPIPDPKVEKHENVGHVPRPSNYPWLQSYSPGLVVLD